MPLWDVVGNTLMVRPGKITTGFYNKEAHNMIWGKSKPVGEFPKSYSQPASLQGFRQQTPSFPDMIAQVCLNTKLQHMVFLII